MAVHIVIDGRCFEAKTTVDFPATRCDHGIDLTAECQQCEEAS